MSETPPPPPAACPTPPPPPAQQPTPPAPPQAYAPGPAVPPKPMGKVVPIIAAVLAGLAFLTAIIPGPSFTTWVFAIPAIILAIIALVRKAPMKGLSLAAVIVAPIAWLIAIVVSSLGMAAFNAGFQSGLSGGDDNTSSETQQVEETNEPEAPKPDTIAGGDHIVGPDFAAGQYRAEVEPSFLELCSVSQEADGNITDLRTSSEGSVIFTVQDLPGSVVSFSGCENIALAADVIRPTPNPVTNGDWLVGSELPAGQYKGTVDTASIIQLGAITQYNGKDVIDLNTATEGDVVFTVQDLPGSVVSFSGLVDIQKVG